MSSPPPEPAVRRLAAQYVRMSSEQQVYSIPHQMQTIAAYAAAHDIDIVRTYADEGVSGISLSRRKGLQALFADVLGPDREFELILVYDVSRWGRFQNPDESAHYEFLCGEAGVRVEYCTELFANDESLTSTIMKSVKRVMAAEFSRELGAKVRRARRDHFARGFWLGGPAGYGLRRQMVAPDGTAGLVLQRRQRKAIQGYHSILIPGPKEEVAVVQRIFRLFVEGRRSRAMIVRELNSEGLTTDAGNPWNRQSITRLLTNPKYVGDLVAGRTDVHLGERTARPRADWRRRPKSFQPIVSRALFDAAQSRIEKLRRTALNSDAVLDAVREIYDRHGTLTYKILDDELGRHRAFLKAHFGDLDRLADRIDRPRVKRPKRPHVRLTNDELLQGLAALHLACGHLSVKLINAASNLPDSTTVSRRFGGLRKAYQLVGFVPMPEVERASPVGRARIYAGRLRSEALVLQQRQALEAEIESWRAEGLPSP